MKNRILNQTEDDGFDFKKPQGLFNKITPRRGIGRSGPSDQIWTALIREKRGRRRSQLEKEAARRIAITDGNEARRHK
jgi:hypothetical protein